MVVVGSAVLGISVAVPTCRSNSTAFAAIAANAGFAGSLVPSPANLALVRGQRTW